jgi:DNA-binding transcriptional regulator LsrR (DeoR family)
VRESVGGRCGFWLRRGLSQRQIASELGVSARKVKRDWGKIRAYVKGQYRREIRAVVDARRKSLSGGMKGCYVYFVDKDTEKFFKSRIEKDFCA